MREYNREAFNLVRLAKDNEVISSNQEEEEEEGSIEEDDGQVRAGGSSEGSI